LAQQCVLRNRDSDVGYEASDSSASDSPPDSVGHNRFGRDRSNEMAEELDAGVGCQLETIDGQLEKNHR
jgi:hypothetical protein